MITATLAVLLGGSSVSCMTTYDASGRRVQSVDPGIAVAGAVVAGMVGYSLADDHRGHHRHGYRHRPRYHCR